MSKEIGELLDQGEVELTIDFKPVLSEKILDERLQQDFRALSNKMFKNSLAWLLPKKMIPAMVKMAGISGEKKVNAITREERHRLLGLLKRFPLGVKKVAEIELAIVTAGGVDLKEVDPKTMKSKIVDNLYLAGEILDIDGPTGGFNLQMCWSTGFVAGDSIKTSKHLNINPRRQEQKANCFFV
jgi:predicted Rossmann fold flavoprotein